MNPYISWVCEEAQGMFSEKQKKARGRLPVLLDVPASLSGAAGYGKETNTPVPWGCWYQ